MRLIRVPRDTRIFLDKAATTFVTVVVLQADIRNGALPNMKRIIHCYIQLRLWIGKYTGWRRCTHDVKYDVLHLGTLGRAIQAIRSCYNAQAAAQA